MNKLKEYKRKVEIKYQALLSDKKKVVFFNDKESDE